MGWGLLNLKFYTFLDISCILQTFLVSLAPTLPVGGKISIIPERVSFKLHFIGKVGVVFWKLSLGIFTLDI